MEGFREEHRTVLATVPVGEKTALAFTEQLPKGDHVYMGVVAQPEQPGLVRIAVKRNSDTILGSRSVTWFDGKIGSFFQRATLIPDNGGSRLEFPITLQKAVEGEDLHIEITFTVLIKDANCAL